MASYAEKSVATPLTGTVLADGIASPASAQPEGQDGLVDVMVADVTILGDVRVELAAQVAARICGVAVGPVAVLARAVGRSGQTATVCESDQGPVTISQN